MKLFPKLALLACLPLTACSGLQQGPPSFPPAPPPTEPVGQIGVPFTATQGAASATVELKKVRYAPSPDGMPAMAILEVTFTGLTDAPYSYSDQQFAMDRGGKHDISPNINEDYRPFMPPTTLRWGVVTKGKTVDGILILRGPTGDGSTTVVFETNEGTQDYSHTIQWKL